MSFSWLVLVTICGKDKMKLDRAHFLSPSNALVDSPFGTEVMYCKLCLLILDYQVKLIYSSFGLILLMLQEITGCHQPVQGTENQCKTK